MQCKYNFPFVTLLYLKTIKSGNDIKLNIKLSLIKSFKIFIYKWYKVLIFNYNGVKPSIINIELETSFWFFGKKDGGSYGGYIKANKPFIKVLINILFYN